jgi:hypothetical protein
MIQPNSRTNVLSERARRRSVQNRRRRNKNSSSWWPPAERIASAPGAPGLLRYPNQEQAQEDHRSGTQIKKRRTWSQELTGAVHSLAPPLSPPSPSEAAREQKRGIKRNQGKQGRAHRLADIRLAYMVYRTSENRSVFFCVYRKIGSVFKTDRF